LFLFTLLNAFFSIPKLITKPPSNSQLKGTAIRSKKLDYAAFLCEIQLAIKIRRPRP